eukprot:Hpha_TRINITY_DN16052_c1_g3::TRINITY_DN16052_c1_g3_i1::g.119361::m.119361
MDRARRTQQTEKLKMLYTQTAGCCCISTMSGLCIAYGFVLLSSSDSRAELVTQFNAAASDWELIHRPAFLRAGLQGVEIVGFPDSSAPRPIQLLRTVGGDEILDDGDDIKSYSRLRYESEGWAPFGTQDGTRPWGELFSSPVVVVGGTGPQKSLALSPFPISKMERKPGTIEKVCRASGGSLFTSEQQCRKYLRVKAVCFVGEFDSNGWVPDSDSSCTLDHGAVSRWEQESLGTVNPVLPPLNLTAVRIVLRSRFDPFFVARNLTDETLNFGPTLAQKHGLAMFLLSVGGVGAGCLLVVAARRLGSSFRSTRRSELVYGGVPPPAESEWQDGIEVRRAVDLHQQTSGTQL